MSCKSLCIYSYIMISASGETRPTAPAHNKAVYEMSPTEMKEWEKDNVATVPSEMLCKAISEESMGDGDWAEVPDLDEWTVCNRKRKGSHCSDPPPATGQTIVRSLRVARGVTPPLKVANQCRAVQ